jgi:alpha-tubulin suppressor-like RCC1 family protein
VQIAAGAQHSVALDALGRVFAWGSGKNGKLGLGDELYRATPVHLLELATAAGQVRKISAGQEHSACISRDGKAFSWG